MSKATTNLEKLARIFHANMEGFAGQYGKVMVIGIL